MSRRGSWDSCVSQSAVGTQLPATAVPTVVKVCLALVPRVVMAAMQTTMIKASITAYSTAVGPSSRFRNVTTDFAKFFIGNSRSGTQVGGPDSNGSARAAELGVDGAEGGVGLGAE